MPCIHDDDPNSPENMRSTLDNYAQMLCKACAIIEGAGLEMPPSIARWYEPHKMSDKKRERLDGPDMTGIRFKGPALPDPADLPIRGNGAAR